MTHSTRPIIRRHFSPSSLIHHYSHTSAHTVLTESLFRERHVRRGETHFYVIPDHFVPSRSTPMSLSFTHPVRRRRPTSAEIVVFCSLPRAHAFPTVSPPPLVHNLVNGPKSWRKNPHHSKFSQPPRSTFEPGRFFPKNSAQNEGQQHETVAISAPIRRYS